MFVIRDSAGQALGEYPTYEAARVAMLTTHLLSGVTIDHGSPGFFDGSQVDDDEGPRITVAVTRNGGVTIETDSRIVAMSPFSDRARRLAAYYGQGTHRVDPVGDAADIRHDIAESLS